MTRWHLHSTALVASNKRKGAHRRKDNTLLFHEDHKSWQQRPIISLFLAVTRDNSIFRGGENVIPARRAVCTGCLATGCKNILERLRIRATLIADTLSLS